MFTTRKIGSMYRRQLQLQTLELRQLMAVDAVQQPEPPAWVELAEGEDAPMADFSLVDVNPNSATYNQSISPRQYLGKMSAWYFGHAT